MIERAPSMYSPASIIEQALPTGVYTSMEPMERALIEARRATGEALDQAQVYGLVALGAIAASELPSATYTGMGLGIVSLVLAVRGYSEAYRCACSIYWATHNIILPPRE